MNAPAPYDQTVVTSGTRDNHPASPFPGDREWQCVCTGLGAPGLSSDHALHARVLTVLCVELSGSHEPHAERTEGWLHP